MLDDVISKALSSMKDPDMDQDGDEEDQGQIFDDPRAMSQDMQTIFLDSALVPKGVQQGDEIYVCCTVKSLGDKVGLIPEDAYTEDEVDVKDGYSAKGASKAGPEDEAESDKTEHHVEPDDDK
jgi:hypothetical protein